MCRFISDRRKSRGSCWGSRQLSLISKTAVSVPSPRLRPSRRPLISSVFTSLPSEQQHVSAVPLRAVGRRAGCSELPQKAVEEAAPSGANSDVCGDETWRGGRGRVPAHPEAEQRWAAVQSVLSRWSNQLNTGETCSNLKTGSVCKI